MHAELTAWEFFLAAPQDQCDESAINSAQTTQTYRMKTWARDAQKKTLPASFQT